MSKDKIKCPSGQIERVGYSYTKKSGTYVEVDSSCVPDKGKPGKGQKLITMPEYDIGLLTKYGYNLRNSHDERVKSIKKAIKENSELKILRHINALRTLQKSNKTYYNKLDKDLKWIQKDYLIKNGGSLIDLDKELLNYNDVLSPKIKKKSSKKASKKGQKTKTK